MLSKLTETYPVTLALAVGAGLLSFWLFNSFSVQLLGLAIGAIVGFIVDANRER